MYTLVNDELRFAPAVDLLKRYYPDLIVDEPQATDYEVPLVFEDRQFSFDQEMRIADELSDLQVDYGGVSYHYRLEARGKVYVLILEES